MSPVVARDYPSCANGAMLASRSRGRLPWMFQRRAEAGYRGARRRDAGIFDGPTLPMNTLTFARCATAFAIGCATSLALAAADDPSRRARPLHHPHQRLQRLPYARLRGDRRRRAGIAVAGRRSRRLQGSVGRQLSVEPAPHRADDDGGRMAALCAQPAAPADAVVQPARHVRRRPARHVPLHPLPRPRRYAGAGIRAARCGRAHAVDPVRAAEPATGAAPPK